MKHTRSAAEWEIRDAVLVHARAEFPGARIVHELVVGGSRADLAVIGRERLILVEIKSEKDGLDRLGSQLRDYLRAAHDVVAVLHRRFFDTTPYADGSARLAAPQDLSGPVKIWAYPEPSREVGFGLYRWRWPPPSLRQPHSAHLMALCWRAELIEIASRHRIAFSSRARISDLVALCAWHMTGQEICLAVCGALRRRDFAEADPPINRAEVPIMEAPP